MGNGDESVSGSGHAVECLFVTVAYSRRAITFITLGCRSNVSISQIMTNPDEEFTYHTQTGSIALDAED